MPMNTANKLTLARVFLIPVFLVIAYWGFPGSRYVALAVYIAACLTDLLDGYIARKYHLVTNLGKFLDPIADKVLVSTALILMLTVDAILPPLFSIAVAVILARELIVSGFRMVAASRGLVLAADKIGKVKTVFQDLAIFVLLAGYDFFGVFDSSPDSVNPINVAGLVLLVIAAVLTIWSGVSYIVKNREVLKESE